MLYGKTSVNPSLSYDKLSEKVDDLQKLEKEKEDIIFYMYKALNRKEEEISILEVRINDLQGSINWSDGNANYYHDLKAENNVLTSRVEEDDAYIKEINDELKKLKDWNKKWHN